MTSTMSVALAGATGNIGAPVSNGLLNAGFDVTILTRQGSKSTSKLPNHPRQTIKEVDFSSLESLKPALEGVRVLISTMPVSPDVFDSAKLLVDAAVAAGVSRFLPSEFGGDMGNPLTAKLPVYQNKIAIQDYVKSKAAADKNFTYTLFYNNAFLDWGLQVGFLLNPKEHTGTLYDGGDLPFSTTRLSTVAEGVVGVINHLDITANKEVFIHDGVTTQNKIIKAAKEKDGQDWSTSVKSLDEVEKESYEALSRGGDGVMSAMYGFLYLAVWKQDLGGVYTGKTWNERLGMKLLTEDEFEQVIRDVV